MFEFMTQCETVYINTNEHYRASVELKLAKIDSLKWLRDKYPAHNVAKS